MADLATLNKNNNVNTRVGWCWDVRFRVYAIPALQRCRQPKFNIIIVTNFQNQALRNTWMAPYQTAQLGRPTFSAESFTYWRKHDTLHKGSLQNGRKILARAPFPDSRHIEFKYVRQNYHIFCAHPLRTNIQLSIPMFLMYWNSLAARNRSRFRMTGVFNVHGNNRTTQLSVISGKASHVFHADFPHGWWSTALRRSRWMHEENNNPLVIWGDRVKRPAHGSVCICNSCQFRMLSRVAPCFFKPCQHNTTCINSCTVLAITDLKQEFMAYLTWRISSAQELEEFILIVTVS